MSEDGTTPETQLKQREETTRIEQQEAATRLARANAEKAEAEVEKLRAGTAAAAKKLELDVATAQRAARLAEDEAAADAGKKQAERQKAVAEAQKATREALFPGGQTKALEGTTTLDDKAGFIADLVAHQALSDCAAAIGRAIDAHPETAEKNVLLVDSLDFARADLVAVQVQAQLTYFEDSVAQREAILQSFFQPSRRQLTDATEGEKDDTKSDAGTAGLAATTGLLATVMGLSNPVTLGLAAAVSGVGLATDLAGYFATDYSIKGRQLSVSAETVKATVAGAIHKPKVQIFSFRRVEASAVLAKFTGLIGKQAEVAGVAEAVRLKLEYAGKLKELIAELRKAAAKTEKPAEKEELLKQAAALTEELGGMAPEIAATEQAVQRWKTTSAAVDAFAKGAVTVAAGRTLSPLATAAMMESLADPAVDLLLWVEASSIGGETITERSRLLVWLNNRLTYLGGAAVSYVLADKKGRVLLGETTTSVRRVRYSLNKGEVEERGTISL